MRYRRRYYRRELTPAQKALQQIADAGEAWVNVLTVGLADHLKQIDTAWEFKNFLKMTQDLGSAINTRDAAAEKYERAIKPKPRKAKKTE